MFKSSNVFETAFPKLEVPMTDVPKRFDLAMTLFQDLGIQFAEIMQQRQMPVDRVIVSGKNGLQIDGTTHVHKTSLPVWSIFGDYNLTGGGLFTGNVTYRAGAQYPSPERHDRADFRRTLRTREYDIEKAHTYERNVGLTPTGVFIALNRRVEYGKKGQQKIASYRFDRDAITADRLAKPQDFFAIDTRKPALYLGFLMKRNLRQVIARYSDLMQREINSTPQRQLPIVRPDGYYEPKVG